MEKVGNRDTVIASAEWQRIVRIAWDKSSNGRKVLEDQRKDSAITYKTKALGVYIWQERRRRHRYVKISTHF